MKKGSRNRKVDELRPEYDLSKLKGGVREEEKGLRRRLSHPA
jgi:hypothetical protein